MDTKLDDYEQALSELESGNVDKGLWAKCFAEADGDENKAKAKYISSRVASVAERENLENLREEGVFIAKQELKDGLKLDRALWEKLLRDSNYNQAVANERYVYARSEEYAKKKTIAEIKHVSNHIQHAVIKVIFCLFGLYLFAFAQVIFKLPDANIVFLGRVVVLMLGFYLLSVLCEIVKKNIVLTLFLAVIPLIGWGALIYFAHVNNKPIAATV